MPEKDFSLLKPYTNYDKIRDMSIDEMAYMLMCPYGKDWTYDFCKNKKNCIDCTKQWLESEAEK